MFGRRISRVIIQPGSLLNYLGLSCSRKLNPEFFQRVQFLTRFKVTVFNVVPVLVFYI